MSGIHPSNMFLSRDSQALENLQKRAVKFVKGLCHLPYEAVLHQLRLFLALISVFPWDAVFAAPTRYVLRCYAFKIRQHRCNARRNQHALSV